MALTKTGRSLVASGTTNASGATATGSSFETKYAASVVGKITNGGTGPTTPCGMYVEYSSDNSTWLPAGLVALGDTANSSVTSFEYPVNPAWQYCRVKFTGNTGQTVTVQADASAITLLS